MNRYQKTLALMLLMLLGVAQMSAKVKVACIGNSITYGATIADRERDSYPAQLQRMLGDNYEVGNFGRNGATLLIKGHNPYIKTDEFKRAMAFAGDICVIHLGINDTDPRNWPNYGDEFLRDYITLTDSLRSANPNVRFLIARLTPISHRHHRFLSGTRDWRDAIQKKVEKAAEIIGAQLIDFEEPLYDRPDVFGDGLHPNAEGAGILAKVVYGGITGDYGGLKMPAIYGNDMMMQAGRELLIKGTANAGKQVVVKIDGKEYKTETDSNGKWQLEIKPLTAGKTYTLTVNSEKQKLTFKNVLAGEIWLCSGQSNMAFRFNQCATYARDKESAKNKQIRFYNMKPRWETNDAEWDKDVLDSINRLEYYKPAKWEECTPETASDFSAVGYYFGKALNDSLQVPIGLICNAVGGSGVEAWVDRSTLEHRMPEILNDWKHNDFIQGWVRGRAAKNIAKADNQLQRHPYEPAYLYEAGMKPLADFAIGGMIWYQGESNAHNVDAFRKLMGLFSSSIMKLEGRLIPFHMVQLSSLDRPSWPAFRNAQRLWVHQRIAVCSDLGDSLDVHPTRKLEVGQRLARLALRYTYKHENCTPQGPTIVRAERVNDNEVALQYTFNEGLKTNDGKALRTFEVAGEDELFYPAEARIENGMVTVKSDKVKVPVRVRYGWQPYTRANLVNGDDLPASTMQIRVRKLEANK